MPPERSASVPSLNNLEDLERRPRAVAIADLRAAVPSMDMQQIQSLVHKVSQDSDEIKAALNKPDSSEKIVLKDMQTIGKAVSLMSKIAPKCDHSCKVVVDIVNNLADVSLELVTQSDSNAHKGACGIFQTAPDAFIGPGSGTSILSSARRWNFDNYNGVIYRVVLKEKTIYLTIAWAFPSVAVFGKGSRYYLEVSEELGDTMSFVKKGADNGTSGVIDTSKKGDGSKTMPFKLRGAFSDPRIYVIVEPLK